MFELAFPRRSSIPTGFPVPCGPWSTNEQLGLFAGEGVERVGASLAG
jgi:hypothetical protein